MFEFKSKPVQISDGMVLCQDGSLWQKQGFNSFEQCACYKAPEKKERVVSEATYSREFEYMWGLWKSKVKNSSNKKLSAASFSKLTKEEQTALCYSIDPYSRTNNEHQYLKRCETYINQKHWESMEIPAMTKPVKEEVVDRNVDLRGKF